MKTQYSGSAKMQSIGKMKAKSFIDANVKLHSIAPGVGAYKPEKSFDSQGRSLFMRTKRY